MLRFLTTADLHVKNWNDKVQTEGQEDGDAVKSQSLQNFSHKTSPLFLKFGGSCRLWLQFG